ncbi:hypothetical protein QQS21_010742 [Conoideocrella luteorostrata]|uniref:Sacsin/Nov domain-containing protein n=1 Tax=Conoideocrella luteorostrata TaxID=1105319 RepID=A0AAJ0CFE9_9HYPO|nr:hypothetical protein QQS21_010742 [Conoideocrella luteorostrata]
MTIPHSRQEARQLVLQIAKKHGYLNAEKFKKIEDDDLRHEIEESFMQKDLIIGASVITQVYTQSTVTDKHLLTREIRLAKNVYSSKARFIFELLQNADDNSYTKAKGLGEPPKVDFHVYPHQIVMECNEDGFTEENLSAICSVGKSSKAGAQGYIGEKGIGFKSVFMVASKVHIQSGAFSFSFSHESGQSGIGMISPEWEDTQEDLSTPLTRTTLHLHHGGDPALRAKLNKRIKSQFSEIQETFLLFTRRVRKVGITYYDEQAQQTSSIAYAVDISHDNFATVTKKTTTNAQSRQESKFYHVTKYTATNIAKDENRAYSEKEMAARTYAKSEIVLAFPLSATSVPVINSQNIFAFFPVRDAGFNFIIQADFVTEASRQDIVHDSPRNATLLDGMATAFSRAVVQFCHHETSLRFQWIRYLPEMNDRTLNPFWRTLVDKIANNLSSLNCLYGHKTQCLHHVRDLVRLEDELQDENGQPLFDDRTVEQIISPAYAKMDLELLSKYGLKLAGFDEIIAWVKDDLNAGPHSRYRSAKTTEDWHQRVSNLLLSLLDKGGAFSETVKKLDLVPLEDGIYVSASSVPVYFPSTKGMRIPSDVGLKLVSKNVADSSSRRLFKLLGVKQASPSRVRKRILQKYSDLKETMDTSQIDLPSSKHHLVFLYNTEGFRGEEEVSYSVLAIHDNSKALRYPATSSMYIANSDIFGPRELLRESKIVFGTRRWAPGHKACFVNEEYFVDGPLTPSTQEHTWIDWFYTKLCVKRCVTVVKRSGLTTLGKYIQKYRPEKFIGALHASYQLSGEISVNSVRHLQDTKVLCRGNRQVLLKDTYFPTIELERRVNRYFKPGAFFPWLHLEADTTHDISSWNKLMTDLGIIPVSDLLMALDMLKYSMDAISQPSCTGRLFKLYSHIQEQFRDSDNQEEAQRTIRDCTLIDYADELEHLKEIESSDFDAVAGIYRALLDAIQSDEACNIQSQIRIRFQGTAFIYVPTPDGPAWYEPSECVWSNTAKLKGRVSINEFYEDLQELFVDTCGVKVVDLSMAIDQLREVASLRPVSKKDIKTSIWTTNSLLSISSDSAPPGDILESTLFPVRFPNGTVTCCSTTTDFFIADRATLRQSFAQKVNLLDFTLEEVVQLRPFLQWTGLQERYMSLCVREITMCQDEGAMLISRPNRQIHNRAHALLRVAAHFDNPRPRSRRDLERLYGKLRNAEIYATDEIVSFLQLSHQGKNHKIKGKKTTLFLDEKADHLKVYIPRNKDDQTYTFSKLLAERLFRWMMGDESSQLSGRLSKDGIRAVSDVLLCPRSRLDTALDDDGIATIDIANQDDDFSDDEASATIRNTIKTFGDLALGSSSDSDPEAKRTPTSSVLSL